MTEIKELAGFGDASTVNCACQQPSPINTDSVHPMVPCQQAIITF